MKKIFTFLLVLASFSTFAQSLTMAYQGNPLNNGDTLEVIVSQPNTTTNYFIDLTNVTSTDVSVTVYKTEIDISDGSNVSFCVGGMCYETSAIMSIFPVLINANSTLSSETSEDAFHLRYSTPVAGVSYVRFTFANTNNYEDHVDLMFKLVYAPDNIPTTHAVTKMHAYPNPASDNVMVEYAYSGSSNTIQLVVKNMLGATLYTRELDANGNKVKMNVSEYPAGIYFYSIEADGRPLVTKKLLVK